MCTCQTDEYSKKVWWLNIMFHSNVKTELFILQPDINVQWPVSIQCSVSDIEYELWRFNKTDSLTYTSEESMEFLNVVFFALSFWSVVMCSVYSGTFLFLFTYLHHRMGHCSHCIVSIQRKLVQCNLVDAIFRREKWIFILCISWEASRVELLYNYHILSGI